MNSSSFVCLKTKVVRQDGEGRRDTPSSTTALQLLEQKVRHTRQEGAENACCATTYSCTFLSLHQRGPTAAVPPTAVPQVAPVGRRSQEHVQGEWAQRLQYQQEQRSRPPPATGGDLEVKQLLPAIIPSGGRRGASGLATGGGTSPTTSASTPQTPPRQLSPLKKRNNNADDDGGKERSGRVESAPPLSEGEQEAAELLQQVREWRAFQRNHPRRLREENGGLLGGGNERGSLQVDAKEETKRVQPSANDNHDSTTFAGEPTTHDVPVAAVPSTPSAAANVSSTTTTSSSSISPSNPSHALSSPAAGSSPSSRRPKRVPTVVLETHVIRELYARREAESKAAARLDAARPTKMASLSTSSNNNNNDGSSGDVASLVTVDDAGGAVGFDGSADAEERRRRPHHRRVRRFSDLGLRGLTLVGLPLEVLGDDVGGDDEGKGDGTTQLFHGMIKEYDPVLNRHRVRYDDGVEEWHDLQLLAYSTPLRNIPSPARRNVRRRGFGEGRDERGEGAAEAKRVVLTPLVRLGDKVRVLWDDVDGGQRWCEGFVERMREEGVDAGGGGDEGVRGEGSGGEVGSDERDDGEEREEREERGGVEEEVLRSGDRETPTLVVSVLVGYTDGDRRWHAFPGDFVYEKIDDDIAYK